MSPSILRVLPLLWFACTAASPAPRDIADTRWMSIALDGKVVGRGSEITRTSAAGTETRSSWTVRIGRLGTSVEMASDTTSIEDGFGRLTAVHARLTLSNQTTTADVVIAPGAASVDDGRHTRSMAVVGPLLGPAAIRRASARALRAVGDRLDYTTWSSSLSAPQGVHCAVDKVETSAIDGVPTAVVRVVVDADREGRHVVWLDDRGREVRISVALPFGTMVTTTTRSEPAMAVQDMDADFFAKTLVRSNVRIPGARSLDKLRVHIAIDDPTVAMPLDGEVVGHDANGVELEVQRRKIPPASIAVATTELLGTNGFIDPTDPGVRAIALEAIGDATEPWERARRLTRWVTGHMTFDGGVAFAPAAELARDRRGTCAGYAVLLASLLRAAGIPARLDLGLVYVDGVFAGHAWVDAFVRGSWVPLDAAIPSDGPADAARLVVAHDDLDGGPGAALSALGQFLGHAKIRVAGYTTAGGRPVRVDPTAPLYTMDDARYTNPGLGFSVALPPGARFRDADAVWPDPTIVAIDGLDGRAAIVETSIDPGGDLATSLGAAACVPRVVAGHPGCTARENEHTRIAFSDGPTVYIVDAHGPHATVLADTIAKTVRSLDAAR